jgi:hypothetical protein
MFGKDGIDPTVVRLVADGVVVEKGNRFMQVMQYLRVPCEIGVQHVARQGEVHGHGVAVVVVRDVVTPVKKVRIVLIEMCSVPAVHIDHPVAAIDFDNRRDQSDDVRADVLNVGRVVDCKAIGQLHKRGGRARFW